MSAKNVPDTSGSSPGMTEKWANIAGASQWNAYVSVHGAEPAA